MQAKHSVVDFLVPTTICSALRTTAVNSRSVHGSKPDFYCVWEPFYASAPSFKIDTNLVQVVIQV